jgi:hypothetical protein
MASPLSSPKALSEASSPRAISETRSNASSPRVVSNASSPRAFSETKSNASSPRAISESRSNASSPVAKSQTGSRDNLTAVDDIDMSLFSWVTNTHSVLHWPLTVLSVAGLVILGSFIEIAPRKSLDFLDNILGRSLFFILPFLIAILTDWSTGLLAGVVSLIIFARLQKQDSSEGFSDTSDGTDNSTKIISNSHRWFIERVLGESPVAISSDRITTSASKGSDVRSSSSTLSTESNPVDRSSSSSYK